MSGMQREEPRAIGIWLEIWHSVRGELVAVGAPTQPGVIAASGSPKFVGIAVGASVVAGAIGSAVCKRSIYNASNGSQWFDHVARQGTHNMKVILAAVSIVFLANAVSADNLPSSRGTFYHSRYLTLGFLLRASNVCEGDWKRTAKAGFDLVGTSEFKAISEAYPDTIRQWMEEGGREFNTKVMTDGIGPACAHAMTVRRQAEEATAR
jgi:hypothetical protein